MKALGGSGGRRKRESYLDIRWNMDNISRKKKQGYKNKQNLYAFVYMRCILQVS